MADPKLTPEQLRKHKGVSFVGVTTVFFCYNNQGQIFLSKRSKQTRDEHGRWDPGAGGLKHGQTLVENLNRELLEEYNVRPQKTDFVGYLDVFRTDPDGQPSHWLAMFFAVKVNPSQVKINEPNKVDDAGWFSLDKLPAPLHSQFHRFMKMHGDKLRKIINS